MSTTATRPPASDRTHARTAAPAQSGIRIDPLRVLRQNKWKIVIAAAIGVMIGAAAKVICDQTYPLYSGTVLFELQASITDPKAVATEDTRGEEAVERLSQTEAARLLSRSLLESAMRNPDVERTRWSERFRDVDGKFVVEKAVDNLEESLTAGHRRRTQYFALNWSTNSPEDVPVVLNRIADQYLDVRRASDDRRFSQNLSLFNQQLQKLDTDLSSIGLDISQFIRDKNITALNDAATDINQSMEDLSRRIGESKGQLSITQTRKSQTEGKLDGRLEKSSEDIRRAEEDPVLLRMNSTLRDLRIGAEIAKSKFGKNHTEYRSAERTVAASEAEVAAALNQIVERNLTADFKEYSDQAEGLASLLEKYEGDFARLETRLKEFAADRSDLDQLQDRRSRLQEQRSKLLDLIADLNSLKMREDARAVTIAQRASTPREKSFPKWSVMVPLGLLLGLMSALAFAFIRELLDQRVRYASDLAGMPAKLLGMVPDLEDDPTGVKRVENAIREAPQSVIAETLRQAASHVQKQMRSGGHKSLLVVGGLPEAGVTSIITNLAESMSSAGQRVLVIDANFRRPGMAKAFGVDPSMPGLGEVVAGRMALEKAVVPIADRVHFLNAGAPNERVFERLAMPSTDATLAAARDLYDAVIIDAPPAVVASDALVLAGKVDATMLVVRAFQEQRGLVSRLVSQLHDTPSAFLGIVLNRPRNTAGGYFRKNFETMAKYAGSASK